MHFNFRVGRPIVTLLLSAAMLTLSGQAGFTKSFVFYFRNVSGTLLQYQLYAAARGNVWPGVSKTYSIPPDGKLYNVSINCQADERVCFGAWIDGRSDFFWGVGRNSANTCSHCCYICRGRATEISTLNPPNLAATPAAPIASAASFRPSFNCDEANLIDAERTVCGDAELSKADTDMSRVYDQIFAEHKGSSSLREEQRFFLKRRDACGTDVACLKKAYWDRYNDLAWMIGEGKSDK